MLLILRFRKVVGWLHAAQNLTSFRWVLVWHVYTFVFHREVEHGFIHVALVLEIVPVVTQGLKVGTRIQSWLFCWALLHRRVSSDASASSKAWLWLLRWLVLVFSWPSSLPFWLRGLICWIFWFFQLFEFWRGLTGWAYSCGRWIQRRQGRSSSLLLSLIAHHVDQFVKVIVAVASSLVHGLLNVILVNHSVLPWHHVGQKLVVVNGATIMTHLFLQVLGGDGVGDAVSIGGLYWLFLHVQSKICSLVLAHWWIIIIHYFNLITNLKLSNWS